MNKVASTVALEPIDLGIPNRIAIEAEDGKKSTWCKKGEISFKTNDNKKGGAASWRYKDITVISHKGYRQRAYEAVRWAFSKISQLWGSGYKPKWIPIYVTDSPDKPEQANRRLVYIDSDDFQEKFKTERAQRSPDEEQPLYDPAKNQNPMEMTHYVLTLLKDQFYKN